MKLGIPLGNSVCKRLILVSLILVLLAPHVQALQMLSGDLVRLFMHCVINGRA